MHACWIDRYKAATRASTVECVVASVKSVAGAASSRFLFAGPPDEVPATLESTVSAAINDTNRMMASDEWTWNSAGNVTATSTFSSAILGACETLPALPVEIGAAGNDSLLVPILIAFLFGALFIMNQFLLRRQNRREHPDCKTSDVGSEEAELTPLTASDSYPSITLDPSCLAAPNNAEDKNSEANENPKETPIQEERPPTTMDPCSTTAQVSPDVNQQKMEDHKSNSTTPSGCSMVEDKDKKLAAKPVNSSSRPPKGPTKKVVAQEAKPGLDIAVLPMKKGLSQEANKDIVEPQESPMKEGLEEKSKPSKDIEKIPNSPTKKRSAAIISTSSNDTGKSPTRPSKKFRLSPSVQEGMAKCMKAWLKKDATNGPSEEGDKQIKSAAVAGAQKDNSQDSISTPISKRALKANANKSATLDGRAKKEQLDHPTQRGNASVATSHITQAQVEGVTKKKSARSTSKEGAKKLSKASTATQKAGLGGYAAPDAADGNVLDSGLAGVDGALASRARVHDEYHARLALVDLAANSDNYYVLRLALVDLAANSDKYYVLQLLVDEKPPKKKRSDKKKGGGPDYYLFTRWGRTGTGVQAKLDGPFDDEDEAKAAFKTIFKSKTGAAWGDAEPGSEPRKGKYAHLATAGSGGSANAQW
ncbi:expressed unknown protein [Seminavis robusta]|uniref:NAD(+) ADP-ribosyltransferase n=1 Tax=Seminavis robusta TaxID=568900 RepID=A0A9N8EW76_9STRA|nr:expressed unknown protein [Seminavis robusta]|eukprot:Sro2456_g328220.1 n/a (648) ;mRNA; f:10484-12427